MKIILDDKEVEVTRISINARCSDLCFAELKDDQGKVIAEHDGYVPELMPGKHYGDYVRLDIDLETGRILNWVKPTSDVIEKTEWKVEAEE
jgi:hypothetical protein